jgi:ligand-binding sensor domain-containing protein
MSSLPLCSSHESEAAPVRGLNTDNGLPHNRVNAIDRDSRGFLWICTDDGLARFDGHQLVTYTRADGLPHMHVNAMLETRTGEYWVATDGELSRFDPRPGQTRFTNVGLYGPAEATYIAYAARRG